MPGLIGQDAFERVAKAAIDLPGADGVEVVLIHEWGGLTRFASSEIHQSTWREDTGLRVRVVSAGRIGVAASNDFSEAGARAAAESALEMAGVVSADPYFGGLAPRAPVHATDGFDERTATATPDLRSEGVATLVAQCPPGFTAAGAFETTAVEVAVATTEGQVCWAPVTQASLTTVVTGGEGGAGFAESFARRVEEIDPEAIGRRAEGKARDSQNPRPLEPGIYEVVLEPNAVSTLVGFLAYMGFGGRSIAEGRSCFSGKEGEKVASSNITIYDDALAADTIGVPFDFEGTPRRRVDLVRNGVFLDGVYDLRTATQAGKQTTGHALPAPNPEGPFPLNLYMQTGDASMEELIGSVQRGLLITRFHYSNVVHPVESTITGMTRDGTFLIEDGEVKHPVTNFRFTQSILEALSAVSMVASESELASEFFFSASRVPGLRIDRFQFTGRSDH